MRGVVGPLVRRRATRGWLGCYANNARETAATISSSVTNTSSRVAAVFSCMSLLRGNACRVASRRDSPPPANTANRDAGRIIERLDVDSMSRDRPNVVAAPANWEAPLQPINPANSPDPSQPAKSPRPFDRHGRRTAHQRRFHLGGHVIWPFATVSAGKIPDDYPASRVTSPRKDGEFDLALEPTCLLPAGGRLGAGFRSVLPIFLWLRSIWHRFFCRLTLDWDRKPAIMVLSRTSSAASSCPFGSCSHPPHPIPRRYDEWFSAGSGLG